MKSKSIFFAAMRHSYLGIFIPLLILFSFVCYFSQIQLSSYMELNYLLTASVFVLYSHAPYPIAAHQYHFRK